MCEIELAKRVQLLFVSHLSELCLDVLVAIYFVFKCSSSHGIVYSLFQMITHLHEVVESKRGRSS